MQLVIVWCALGNVAIALGAPPPGAERMQALRETVFGGESLATRQAAMQELFTTDDVQERLDNVAIIEELIDQVLARPIPTGRVEELKASRPDVALIQEFINQFGAEYAEEPSVRDRIRPILNRVLEAKNLSFRGPAEEQVAMLLLDISDSAEAKRTIALDVIRGYPRSPLGPRVGKYLIEHDLYDAGVAEQIRAMADESLQNGSMLNRGALSILAETGDARIVDSLRAFVTDTPKRTPGWAKADRTLWQIEMQMDQDAIIAYLASCKMEPRRNRVWLVRQAVRMNVPRETLRSAIQQCYDNCPEDALMFMRVAGLDDVVLSTGLFEEAELPSGKRVRSLKMPH